MNQKGFSNIVVVVAVLIVLGVMGYFVLTRNSDSEVLQQGVIIGNEDQPTQTTDTSPTTNQSVTQPKSETASRNWGCRPVTQGTAPDPNNPPPTVCGYIPECSAGQTLVVGATNENWPDGSIKGSFVCSFGPPPPSAPR